MSTFQLEGLLSSLSSKTESGVSFKKKVCNWGTEEEAQALVNEINNCKDLSFLELEGNTLGVNAAKAIGEALKKHPELKVALWQDLFTGRLKNEIPLALESLGKGMIFAGAKLNTLDCSDNALGPNGMVGLVELLKSPTCYSLQELRLNNCGLGIDGGKMLAKALLACHAESSKAGTPLSLKVFIAGRNRLENAGATALAEVFKTLKSLETVAMPQNGIYYVGITALSGAFMHNENMKVLNLNDNTIGPKGCAALVPAFKKMNRLIEINLGDCLIKTAGAISLGNALAPEHVSLQSLDLGFNEIGNEGGRIIYRAMDNKINLKLLQLSGNNFSSSFRSEIVDNLEKSGRIDALEIQTDDESGNDEDEEDQDGEDEDDESEEYEDEEEDEEEDDDEEKETDKDDTNVSSTTLNSTVERSFNLSTISDNSICFVDQEILPNTIETFCRLPNPSEEIFNGIKETNKIEAFRKYLKTLADEEYLIYLVFTILKCSAISEKSPEALEIAKVLYHDVFEYAKNSNEISRVKNFFLIQLGLLKCEDKSFHPAYDFKACRNVLSEVIQEENFCEDARTTFKLFLERF